MQTITRFTACSLALMLLLLLAVRADNGTATGNESGPPLSNIALLSRFAQENGLAQGANALLASGQAGGGSSSGTGQIPVSQVLSEIKVNQDFSRAPQNETTIAVNPSSPNMILAGANDYRLGVPVGAAFYVSTDGGNSWHDGFPPFPMLAGAGGDHAQSDGASSAPVSNDPDAPKQTGGQVVEPPSGTGDPVIAFGTTRSAGDLLPGSSVAYYGYLGVSASHCEQGIFVSRSLNGLYWTRPSVPPLLPPNGLFTPVYWDRPDDCSIFNDKPWLAVDRSGGPHDGRVYVVWARFLYNEGQFRQSTIEMAFSDDDAETWSPPINVSGVSPELCPAQVSGRAGQCDESQFATAVVGPDGTLYTAFINQQAHGEEDGFRNQYLITSLNPDTMALSAPHRAASMIDGKHDLPVGGNGLATLCNSNFRLNTAGNLAIDPSDPTGKTLYIVFADNRNGSSFPNRTLVTQDPPDSFLCPEGTNTDADIFIVRSTDGGVTWRNPATNGPDPLRLNQDAQGDGKDQWFPFAAVGLDGKIAVVFFDRRDDVFNQLANVYLATSGNAGQTWTEQRLTSVSSNLNYAFDQGQFIGDYNGVAVSPDGTIYPFWTDARNGTNHIRQSDVYTAAVFP